MCPGALGDQDGQTSVSACQSTMRSDGRDSSTAASNSSDQSPGFHSDNAAPSAPHVPAADASPSADFITRLEILSTKVPNIWIAPFCGAIAGVASGIVTCPLDVIKTKLQAQGGFARRAAQSGETKALYRGMIGTGKIIFREDGLRGLYQGLGPMLMGYLPTWAVYLAVYDKSREYFYEETGRWSCFGYIWLRYTDSSQAAGGYHEDMLLLLPELARRS